MNLLYPKTLFLFAVPFFLVVPFQVFAQTQPIPRYPNEILKDCAVLANVHTSNIDKIKAYVDCLDEKLQKVSIVCSQSQTGGQTIIHPTVVVQDANLQIASKGTRHTGNLIVGVRAISGQTGHIYQSSTNGFIAGVNNRIEGESSSIVGGMSNSTSAISGNAITWSVAGSICGGMGNQVRGKLDNNQIEVVSIAPVVIGGSQNISNSSGSVVSGGQLNRAEGLTSSVIGGSNNLTLMTFSTIVGGRRNVTMGTQQIAGSICGGGSSIESGNTVLGSFGVVVGGRGNRAVGESSVVVGGRNNTGLGILSTVTGGRNANPLTINPNTNPSFGRLSLVSGGESNIAQGIFSVVSGGRNNVAVGVHSLISGGGSANNVWCE